MDFEIRQEERARGRAFGERAIAGSVARRDREAAWDDGALPGLGEAGLLGAPLPRDVGGEGMDLAGFSALLQGFAEGSGDAGLGLAWVAHVGAALRIAAHGTPEQRRRLLPAMARGETIGASARREAAWVVNGGVATVFVVDARTDPARGNDGIATFLVERDAPGLHIGPRRVTSGLRTAVIADLTLSGVEIPREACLVEEGAAFARAARAFRSWEQMALYAVWLGSARALLDQTVARSRESVYLGRPLACSQAARATLADLRIQVELAERVHARAARLDGADVAVASLFLARALPWVTREACCLQGEAGVEQGHLAERSSRDAAVIAHLAEPEATLRSAVGGALLHLGSHPTEVTWTPR